MKKEIYQKKHNLLAILLFIIPGILLFSGCGSGIDNDDSFTPLSISFSIPSAENSMVSNYAGSVAQAVTVAPAVPTIIRSISIEITASDMSDITDVFDVSSGEIVTKTYDVSSGANRMVRAEAYDGPLGTGNLLYTGETVIADLNGAGVTVALNMILYDITEALRVFETGDIEDSMYLFRAAVSKHAGEISGSEATANFFYAVTRIFSVWSDMQTQAFGMTYDYSVNDGLYDFNDIIDALTYVTCGTRDCDNDFQTIGDPVDAFFAGMVCPENLLDSPGTDGAALSTFLNDVMRPEFEGALANLNNASITSSFNNRWNNNLSWDDLYGAEVESDFADVLYFRAMTGAAIAVLKNDDDAALNALNDIESAMTRINTMEDSYQDDDWVDLIDLNPLQQIELLSGISTARGCLGP